MNQTIAKTAQIEFEEKKSKFIGYITPVSSVSEAEAFIAQIKKQHLNATHNVPVYRVIEHGQEFLKYHDDGEPSGTAGKPMADIAIVKNVYNFALVATRYFGGVKLGSGGLIRMYAKVAKLALEAAEIVTPVQKIRFKLTFPYELTTQVNELLYRTQADMIQENYSDSVTLTIEVTKAQQEAVHLYGVSIEKID